MQSPQAKLKQITRLLALWPSANGSGEEQLRGYLLAVDDYTAADVEAAVETLIKGIAPGVNPNFLPPPPAVGAECRRQMNLRLDRERREEALRPRLVPPPVVHDPESQHRVAELVKRTAAQLLSQSEAEATTRRKVELWQRTNARFDTERYSVGDPDGDAA